MPTLFESSFTKTQPNSPTPHGKPLHSILKGQNVSQMKPLASFALVPDNVRFETQEAEEVVELFLRQHPVVNIPWILVTFILVTVPVIVFPMLLRISPMEVPGRYLLVGTAFWYLATFGYALTNFIYWFFNIYIVTNERLVDIDFLYLLYKRFSQAELAKVQDLSYTSGGILAAIFDYGNVSVETAGEAPNLDFEKIPHPEKVVETIRALNEAEKGEPV